MNTAYRRLERLEALAASPIYRPRQVHRFLVQGPRGLPAEDAAAFLRECGHEIRPSDLTIIRHVVGAEDGRPVDLPLQDLTPCQS